MRISFALLILLLGACSTPVQPTLVPEDIYDDQGLQIITSSFNDKQQTISALYGNPVALKAAGDTVHTPGEDYRLVTWDQKAHPLWFGSQINGALKTVERVFTSLSADGSVKINYELMQGAPVDMDEQKRITFILRQKASLFP